jgi:ribosome maturation factor RimP
VGNLPTFFVGAIMAMYRESLFRDVMATIEPLIEAEGAELVELQLHPQKGRWLVRVFVDTEDGISLEDCRQLSLEIGQVLDAEELIPSSYTLEVSSPGLDRLLRTPRDFRRQLRRLVTITLSAPLWEKTRYRGRVAAVTEEYVVLHQPPDAPLDIPLLQIDHGVVELEFK